jgi:probable F420-dependent oxidoreductase
MQVLLPIHGLTDAPAEAARMAAAGADGVFTFEGPHDVFLPLALAASAGVSLMTNVAIAFPRNAVHLAHSAWDLQALSGGRFTLGLGTQVRTHVERRFGVDFDDPVGRMRDTVEAVRAVFGSWQDGVPLDHRGPYRHHTLMTPVFTPPCGDWGPPPVVVGGLGPRMCEMAAEVADGLAVMAVTSERYFTERTLEAVGRGLARRAGSAPGFELLPELIVCAGRNETEMAAADEGCRGLLGFYASTPAYRPVFELEGHGDIQPKARALTREGRWADLAGLVDDDLLARITVRGTPAEVAAEIGRRYRQHAERVALYLPYALSDDLLAELVGEIRAL